ncbi:MAG: inositol monophosphatase family protein [Kineosporiaceae bacterium]
MPAADAVHAPTDLRALLEVARDAVAEAAEVVRAHRPESVQWKGDRDPATEVDVAVERRIRALLAERTPDVAFLGEEEGATGRDGGLLWSLDPVDGTVNYLHGAPTVAVSLGLFREGEAVAGVIRTPFLGAADGGSEYWGAAGLGAWCDGVPIRVSGTAALSGALVSVGDFAVGEGAAGLNERRLRLAGLLAQRAQRVRMWGSAAIDLAFVAAGRTDASAMFTNKPWDTAGGVAIARAAGAVVMDADGAEHRIDSTATVACTPAIAPELRQLLADVGV